MIFSKCCLKKVAKPYVIKTLDFSFYYLLNQSFYIESCTVDDKCMIGECFVNSNSQKYCKCPDNYKGEYCEKRKLWLYLKV